MNPGAAGAVTDAIQPYHHYLPEVAQELTERGSQGILVIDASSLANIEDEYGIAAYEEVRKRLLTTLQEQRGKDYRQEDILALDRHRGLRFLLFFIALRLGFGHDFPHYALRFFDLLLGMNVGV